MLLQISHTTKYSYDQPVDYALQQLRLTPQVVPCQKIVNWNVTLKGGVIEAFYTDHHGNDVHLVNVDAGGQSISITAAGTVDTTDTAGIVPLPKNGPPLWYFSQPTALTTPGPEISALAEQNRKDSNTLNRLHGLSKTAPMSPPPPKRRCRVAQAFAKTMRISLLPPRGRAVFLHAMSADI